LPLPKDSLPSAPEKIHVYRLRGQRPLLWHEDRGEFLSRLYQSPDPQRVLPSYRKGSLRAYTRHKTSPTIRTSNCKLPKLQRPVFSSGLVSADSLQRCLRRQFRCVILNVAATWRFTSPRQSDRQFAEREDYSDYRKNSSGCNI